MRVSTLNSLKPGDLLKFTQKHVEFWAREAWTMCVPPGGLTSEDKAGDYFIRRAISFGLPYHAEFVEHRGDVGQGKPGALVKVRVGTFEDTALIDHTEIKKL